MSDHSGQQTVIRERLTVNKQGSHKFHMEGYNLKKFKKIEGKKKYRVEVSIRFAVLEDLDAEAEINTIWKRLERIYKCEPKRVLVIMN
jgi:hypothetical protein